MEEYKSRNVLGTYNPTLLRLSVKRTFNSNGRIGEAYFFRDEEITTFYHEFIHHMQNISSIIGLSNFDLVISLWHNIRSDIHDKKHGSIRLISEAIINVEKRKNNNIKTTSFSSISNIDFEGDYILTEPVHLKVKIGNTDSDLYFGIYEFMEAAAYTLETVFSKKIGIKTNPHNTPKVPYRLIDAIIEYYNTNLSESALIAVILTSLQHKNPHRLFIEYIRLFSNHDISNETVSEIIISKLKENCIDLIKQNEKWMDDVKLTFENGFPHEDPDFGDIIKSTLNNIIKNIKHRLLSPFIELDMLQGLNENNYKTQLTNLISDFGGCIVIRDRDDKGNDEIEKDTRIIMAGNSDLFRNIKGWEVFQSAMHYTIRHITYKKDSTIEISKPEAGIDHGSKCPLYCSCSYPMRRQNSETCKISPWGHINPKGDNTDCPYQLAVYKTNLCNYNVPI